VHSVRGIAILIAGELWSGGCLGGPRMIFSPWRFNRRDMKVTDRTCVEGRLTYKALIG
jgi:hypothetical protein